MGEIVTDRIEKRETTCAGCEQYIAEQSQPLYARCKAKGCRSCNGIVSYVSGKCPLALWQDQKPTRTRKRPSKADYGTPEAYRIDCEVWWKEQSAEYRKLYESSAKTRVDSVKP